MREESRGVVGAMVRRQRHGILFAIFVLWILSLPFYQYSVVATYSVDNLLAPFLCLMAIFLPGLRDQSVASRRLRVLVVMLGLYFLYGISRLIASAGDMSFFWSVGWTVLRSGFYLMVPALFIRDLWSFRTMKSLLIIVTAIGALSAFFASVGLLHLEVERFAESRIGLSWLPKAIGLFDSYGDMAMLYAFSSVVLISHGRNDLLFGIGTRLGKRLMWIVLLLGWGGSQSRNIFFVTIIGASTYWIYQKLQRSRSNVRFGLIGLVLAGAIVLTSALLTFGDYFVESVSSLGGKEAHATVDDRLMSYEQAWKLLVKEPVFGASAETQRLWGPLLEFLHNMWLNLLLKGGIFALASVAGLLWMAYRAGSRPGKEPLHQAEPALVVSTTASIFVGSQFYPGLTDVMWVLLGTLISFTWVRQQQEGVR